MIGRNKRNVTYSPTVEHICFLAGDGPHLTHPVTHLVTEPAELNQLLRLTLTQTLAVENEELGVSS